MKFGNLDRLLGNRTVSTKEIDPVVVNLSPKESLSNLNNPFDRFHKAFVASLFRKQKPPDQRHPSHQPTDIRVVEASLKRGDKKIPKLEGQINKLESDKHKLHSKVSNQTKVIAKLTKTVSDQTREISKLNKTVLSQKDQIEEINTKGDATQNILQWYNQTNDNLCKRLVDTNNELQNLKKFVDQNII
jgi:chromosome segregation ATPase